MKKADWKEKLREKLYSYLDKYDNFMGDKITAKVMNKENRKFVFFISSRIKLAEARGARRILEGLPIEKKTTPIRDDGLHTTLVNIALCEGFNQAKDELIAFKQKELSKLSKGE